MWFPLQRGVKKGSVNSKMTINKRELKPSALWQPKRLGWGGRWEGGSRRLGHIYISMDDSCWCMAETFTILQNNYHPIKNKWLEKSTKQLFQKNIVVFKPFTLNKWEFALRSRCQHLQWKIDYFSPCITTQFSLHS